MTSETLIHAAIACDIRLWRSQAQMMSWWFKNGGSVETLPPLVAKHLERAPTRVEWRDISTEVRRQRRRVANRPRENVRRELEEALEARHQAKVQERREYMRNLMRKRRAQDTNA